MEVGDEELNFLDLTIIKRDGRSHFHWFRKLTFLGRIIELSLPTFFHTQKRHHFEFNRQSDSPIPPRIPQRKCRLCHQDSFGQWLSIGFDLFHH